MCALRLMPVWMKLCLLAAILGVLLRGQPTPATPVVFGSPPGGVGSACTAPQIGYLNTSTGCLATCQSSVWTCQGGSGGLNLWTENAGTLSPTTSTDSVAIGATVLINPVDIATPSAPVSVTPQGTPGSSTWTYAIKESNGIGVTLMSATTSTTTGPTFANIGGTNFLRIVMPSCVVAGDTLEVWLIAGPAGVTLGRLATDIACGATYDDQTGVGNDGWTDSGINTTTGFAVKFGGSSVIAARSNCTDNGLAGTPAGSICFDTDDNLLKLSYGFKVVTQATFDAFNSTAPNGYQCTSASSSAYVCHPIGFGQLDDDGVFPAGVAIIWWQPDVSCSGGPTTINVGDGNGAKSIKLGDGSTDPLATDCPVGGKYQLKSDGTVWRMTRRPIDPTISAASTGKALCWKTATTLGFCSTVVGVDGSCTCN